MAKFFKTGLGENVVRLIFDPCFPESLPREVSPMLSLKAVAKPKPPCIAACAEYGLGKNKEVSTRHGLAVDLRTWERDLLHRVQPKLR